MSMVEIIAAIPIKTRINRNELGFRLLSNKFHSSAVLLMQIKLSRSQYSLYFCIFIKMHELFIIEKFYIFTR